MKSKAVWVVGIVVVVLLLVLLLLPVIFNANRFRPDIEARLSQSMGRTVKIGDLQLSLLSGGIKASDISIADDPAFSHDPFLRAQSLQVGVELGPLLFDRVVKIESLVIKEPAVRLLQSQAGKWNVSTIGQKQQGSATSSSNDLSIQKLEIDDGKVTVGRASGKQEAYTDLNLKASNISNGKSFPFELQL